MSSQRKNLGTLRSVVVEAREDGCWELSPSSVAPANAHEILVPFGTEAVAEKTARREHTNAPDDEYAHDCWVVIQILNRLWNPPTRWAKFDYIPASLVESALRIPDDDVESWRIEAVINSVDDYLDEGPEETPTVWGEHSDSPSLTSLDTEMTTLLSLIPTKMIHEWSVEQAYSFDTNSVEFRYAPEHITETVWVQATNSVTVRFTDNYDVQFDVDERRVGDAKYVVKDAFGDPFVTTFAGHVVTHLQTRFTRVMEGTEDNATVERAHASGAGTDGQSEILPSIGGIGVSTARKVARMHGTYTNLLEADELGVPLSYHFEGDLEDLKDHIRPTVAGR